MWKEILKIVPNLEATSLNRMVSNLNTRFKTVAKKFGAGFKNAIMGGGVFALAGVAINKLLNPLQAAQDALTKTLANADDIATNAGQFQTTPGNLLKLQTLAQAKGLAPEELFKMLQRFQVRIAETQRDLDDPTKTQAEKNNLTLKNFVGEKDMAKNFLDFIQSLQSLGPEGINKQVLAQYDVFGEKMIGKQSEFLNANFRELFKELSLMPSALYDSAVKSLADKSDKLELDTAKRNLNDVVAKSGIIKDSHITKIGERGQVALDGQNEGIKNFDGLIKAQIKMDKGMNFLGEKMGDLTVALVQITEGVNSFFGKRENASLGGIIKNIGKNLLNSKGVRKPGWEKFKPQVGGWP